MKKPLLLVGLLVGLLLVYFLTQKSNNVVETDRPFVTADSASITALKVSSTDGNVELAKEGEKWRLVKPLSYPANERNVGQALAKFKEMKKLTLVTEKADRQKEFQVDDSAGVKVTVTSGGKDESFILGKTGPSGATTYARWAGKNEIWEIGGSSTGTFKRKPKDWRDKTITDVDMASINKVMLESPKLTTTLTLVDTTWKVESGAQKFDGEKANVERVTRLLSKISAVDFVDSLAANSFDKAEFHVLAETTGGDKIELRMMPVDTSGSQYFVRKTGASSDFTLYKSTITSLMKSPDDFKAKADDAKSKKS